MAAVNHESSAVAAAQTTTSTSFVTKTGVSLQAANFTTGEDHLIIVQAKCKTPSGSEQIEIRVTHGGTAFADSHESRQHLGSFVAGGVYQWFGKWTAVDTEDVEVEFLSLGGGSVELKSVVMSQFQLTGSDGLGAEGTDWHYDEDAVQLDLDTAFTDGASITFTPNGTDEYLCMASGRYAGMSTSNFTQHRLDISGGATRVADVQSQGGDTTNDLLVFLTVASEIPSAAETTFKEQSAKSSVSGSATREHSKCFVLKLNAFDTFGTDDPAGAQALDSTDWNTQTMSVALGAPSVSTDVLALGFMGYQPDPGWGTWRIQADDADTPSDITWADERMTLLRDGSDIAEMNVLGFELAVTAATTWDVDAHTINGSTPDVDDRCLVVFTMEKAAGAVTADAEVVPYEFLVNDPLAGADASEDAGVVLYEFLVNDPTTVAEASAIAEVVPYEFLVNDPTTVAEASVIAEVVLYEFLVNDPTTVAEVSAIAEVVPYEFLVDDPVAGADVSGDAEVVSYELIVNDPVAGAGVSEDVGAVSYEFLVNDPVAGAGVSEIAGVAAYEFAVLDTTGTTGSAVIASIALYGVIVSELEVVSEAIAEAVVYELIVNDPGADAVATHPAAPYAFIVNDPVADADVLISAVSYEFLVNAPIAGADATADVGVVSYALISNEPFAAVVVSAAAETVPYEFVVNDPVAEADAVALIPSYTFFVNTLTVDTIAVVASVPYEFIASNPVVDSVGVIGAAPYEFIVNDFGAVSVAVVEAVEYAFLALDAVGILTLADAPTVVYEMVAVQPDLVVTVKLSAVSGVSPLCVHFDAVETAAAETTRPYHELLYKWTFDDDPIDTWTESGRVKNEEYNPVAGHVFESATFPKTYTPSLTIEGKNRTYVIDLPTISLSDPDVVYPASATWVFSNSSDFTGAPPADNQVTTSDFSDVVTEFGADRRLLLKRGDTFTDSSGSRIVPNTADRMMLSAFGSGAKPVVNKTGTGFALAVRATDVRIVDVEYVLTSSPDDWITAASINLGDATPTDYPFRLFVLRCKVTDCEHFATFRLDQETGVSESIQPSYHEDAYFVDNEVIGSADLQGHHLIWWYGTRGVFLGNNMTLPGGACFNTAYSVKTIVAHSFFSRTVNNVTYLKLHAPPQQSAISSDSLAKTLALPYSRWNVIEDNVFQVPTGVTVGRGFIFAEAEGAGDDARINDLVIERNVFHFIGTGGFQEAIHLGGFDLTYRHNIIVVEGAHIVSTDVLLQHRGVDALTESPPIVRDMHCYNNLLFDYNERDDRAHFFISDNDPAMDAAPINSRVFSNLTVSPGASPAPPMLTDEGEDTASGDNSVSVAAASTFFVSSDPLTALDFRLIPSAPAVDAGGTNQASIYDDWFNTSRIGTNDQGPWDLASTLTGSARVASYEFSALDITAVSTAVVETLSYEFVVSLLPVDVEASAVVATYEFVVADQDAVFFAIQAVAYTFLVSDPVAVSEARTEVTVYDFLAADQLASTPTDKFADAPTVVYTFVAARATAHFYSVYSFIALDPVAYIGALVLPAVYDVVPVTPAMAICPAGHRVSGASPFWVHFDAVDTASSETDRPFHELQYKWNFGDAGQGTWAHSGKSKNRAYGACAAHVFEPTSFPRTYVPSLTVTTPTQKFTYTLPGITVTDPDVVYSGTQTFVYSTDGDFTGAPSGATEVTTSEFEDVAENFAADTRHLLKRGQSFTQDVETEVAPAFTNIYLGAFGSGVRPNIDLASTWLRVRADNIRIADITTVTTTPDSSRDWIRNQNVPVSAPYLTPNLLILRCASDGADTGLHLYQLAAGESAPSPLMAGYYDLVCVQETDILSNNNYCMWWAGSRLAFLGNRTQFTSNAPPNAHNFRSPLNRKGVFSHSLVEGAPTSLVKQHGPNLADKIHSDHLSKRFATEFPSTRWVTYSDNIFRTVAGQTTLAFMVALESQSDDDQELVEDIVYERNWTDYVNASGGLAVRVGGRNITVRNNIVDISLSNSGTAFQVRFRGAIASPIGARPVNIHFYNNLIYDDTGENGRNAFDVVRPVPNSPAGYERRPLDTRIFDNLYVNVGASDPDMLELPDEGVNTLLGGNVRGLTDSENWFLTETPLLPEDFRHVAGSLAIDGGSTTHQVGVFDDWNNLARTGVVDAGPWDLLSTSETAQVATYAYLVPDQPAVSEARVAATAYAFVAVEQVASATVDAGVTTYEFLVLDAEARPNPTANASVYEVVALELLAGAGVSRTAEVAVYDFLVIDQSVGAAVSAASEIAPYGFVAIDQPGVPTINLQSFAYGFVVSSLTAVSEAHAVASVYAYVLPGVAPSTPAAAGIDSPAVVGFSALTLVPVFFSKTVRFSSLVGREVGFSSKVIRETGFLSRI